MRQPILVAPPLNLRSGLPMSVQDFSSDGYVVLRDSVQASGEPRDLFLVFHATSRSLTHKHDDDLSFVLHWGGIEWIADPGYLDYNDQILLKQARSVASHNVVDLGLPYQAAVGGSGLEPPYVSDDSTWVAFRGWHKCFGNWIVKRTLIWHRDARLLFVLDCAKQVGPLDLTPIMPCIRFHCAENISADFFPNHVRLRRNEMQGPAVIPLDYEFLSVDDNASKGMMFVWRNVVPSVTLCGRLCSEEHYFTTTTAIDLTIESDIPTRRLEALDFISRQGFEMVRVAQQGVPRNYTAEKECAEDAHMGSRLQSHEDA